MSTTIWRNWSETVQVEPIRTARPRDVDELAGIVGAAGGEGTRVKAVGSGHSFSAIAAPEGVMVDMGALDDVVRVDKDAGLVTVEAGMPLHRLNRVLDAHGLALENMGDINLQTISGALSTGTHGTGARYGGLATQVRSLDLVLADGSTVTCSSTERPELFTAARVGLGALGVIARVTLKCVPEFRLKAVERPMRLEAVFDRLDEFVEGNDHFEFYWFPNTDRALTKRNNRVELGRRTRPPGRLGYWWHERFTENTLFAASSRAGARFPGLVPRLNRVAGRVWGARDYTDVSHRVFTSPRQVVFREMEYAMPRECLVEAVSELRRMVDRKGCGVSFPVEVRVAAADDIWMSTAYGRETAYVAVHQYIRHPYDQYFRAAAAIFDGLGGRPHWGKMHWLDAAALRGRYPRFDEFTAVRDSVDPGRVFANAYLERVLGA